MVGTVRSAIIAKRSSPMLSICKVDNKRRTASIFFLLCAGVLRAIELFDIDSSRLTLVGISVGISALPKSIG